MEEVFPTAELFYFDHTGSFLNVNSYFKDLHHISILFKFNQVTLKPTFCFSGALGAGHTDEFWIISLLHNPIVFTTKVKNGKLYLLPQDFLVKSEI